MPKRSGAGPVKSKLSSWKIIALRKKLGLNKAAFARQIGVNVNTLWRWERGERKPPGLHWMLIKDMLAEDERREPNPALVRS